MTNYVVASVKPWNLAAFHEWSSKINGDWSLITDPGDLTVARLSELAPRYVFFPHWSWRVPNDVFSQFECVCFHMADVPFGRGGSPLQNLIVRGHKDTKLSALKMVEELDAGPVYLKKSLSLLGSAEEIFERSAALTWQLISEICANQPEPAAQSGRVTIFDRRTPDQSRLPENGTEESLYDFIRMLDAPTYPKAFIEAGDFRIEFDDAQILDGTLTARAQLFPKQDNKN
jgi:methionyl-tRNA formyltransferase